MSRENGSLTTETLFLLETRGPLAIDDLAFMLDSSKAAIQRMLSRRQRDIGDVVPMMVDGVSGWGLA